MRVGIGDQPGLKHLIGRITHPLHDVFGLESRPGCHFVALADERASRTIGAITLKGKSATRLQEAFLAHLRATDPASLASAGQSDQARGPVV